MAWLGSKRSNGLTTSVADPSALIPPTTGPPTHWLAQTMRMLHLALLWGVQLPQDLKHICSGRVCTCRQARQATSQLRSSRYGSQASQRLIILHSKHQENQKSVVLDVSALGSDFATNCCGAGLVGHAIKGHTYGALANNLQID
jgi:hypothetical protein